MLRAAVEGSAMSDLDEIAWAITWSGDIPVAIIFSKEHAAQAARIAVETDLKSPLFLCVNLPKAALFRSIAECIQFFNED
jgi:hypothetical protein